eukprot:6819124-Prymnesium_polylepis.1
MAVPSSDAVSASTSSACTATQLTAAAWPVSRTASRGGAPTHSAALPSLQPASTMPPSALAATHVTCA